VNRCTGVQYGTPGGAPISVACSGEVVLAAGTIGSAQLLMLSGIGPQAHLRDVGVEVTLDLPGVGANLHDHMKAPVVYKSTRPMPPTRGSGHGDAIGLIQTEHREHPADGPDVQLLLIDSTGIGLPGDDGSLVGHAIAASPTQPHSRGSLRLSGPYATDPPIIDPNYFGDERDLRTMMTGLRLARQIGDASAYDEWREAEAAPGPAVDDDNALRAFAKAASQSYFHPVGSCAPSAASGWPTHPSCRRSRQPTPRQLSTPSRSVPPRLSEGRAGTRVRITRTARPQWSDR
jgi:choline dehydrogenase